MQTLRRLLLTTLLILLPANFTAAQDQTSDTPQTPATETGTDAQASPDSADPTGYTSPRAVMDAFLKAMKRANDGHEEAWPDAFACFDFPASLDENNRRIAADHLLDVIDRLGYIDVMTLPGEVAVAPPADSGQEPVTRYQFFPAPRFAGVWEKLAQMNHPPPQGEIVFEADDRGHWRFSRETVSDIPRLYKSTEPLPPAYLEQERRVEAGIFVLVGPTFEKTPQWAWGALLGAIFVGLLAGKIVQSVLRAAAKRMEKCDAHIRSVAFDNAASPASFALLSLGLWAGMINIYREPKLAEFTSDIILFLLILAVGWFLFNLVEVIDAALRRISEKTESKLDDQLVPLVRKSLRLFLVIVFTLVVAQNVFGLDITGWLAGLGIAGLAVSLAAQDSIKNLFGSFTVLFDKPFTVGDWIVTEGVEGTVEEVGFRSTRIRTFYNSLITLPNANLINASVDNYGRRQYRRWKTHIGVQYDTTPDQLIAFTEGIRELVRTHPYTRKDYFQVWCHEFANSSLNILLYIFHEVPDWSTELRERERLFIDIVRLADKLGVQFAFPTQTVHLYKEEHAPYETKHDTPQSMSERRSMVNGIRAAQLLVKDQPWQNNTPGPVTFQKGPTDIQIDEHGNPIIEKEKEE